MRLAPHEVEAIRAAARTVFGPDVSVRLFGARVDEAARGGDVDLFLEVAPGRATPEADARFRDLIAPALDEAKVDVVLHELGRPLPPIARIVLRDGVPCERARAQPAGGGSRRDGGARAGPAPLGGEAEHQASHLNAASAAIPDLLAAVEAVRSFNARRS